MSIGLWELVNWEELVVKGILKEKISPPGRCSKLLEGGRGRGEGERALAAHRDGDSTWGGGGEIFDE